MKEKIQKNLAGDLVGVIVLILCLSRLNYICENIPVVAVIIPLIWLLFGLRFIMRERSYGDIVKKRLLKRCGIICFVIGVFSLLFIFVSFVYKF